MHKKLLGTCLLLCALVYTKTPSMPVTIQLHDAGFIKNGPDDWEKNRKHLIELLKKEKDPNKRKIIAAGGAHGHWTAKELARGLKNFRLYRWNMSNVPFNANNFNAPSTQIKNPNEKQMRDHAKALIAIREEAFSKTGTIPDIVVSPTGAFYLSSSPENREKERKIMAEEFSKFFARYPNTLFIFSAGNNSCNSQKDPVYSWSDIDLENLIVVGSCNTNRERSKFSNFGPDVDIYAHGEDIEIDENALYRFPIFHKSRKYTIGGTSYSAPRIGNLVAKELNELRKNNPQATALDAYKNIRSQSPPLKNKTTEHIKAKTSSILTFSPLSPRG